MDYKGIENLIFMVVCSDDSKTHIILILSDTTFNYIFNEIVDRWKHLSLIMIYIKFYISNNSRMLVMLMMDKDVRNIYKIHLKLKLLCKISVHI